MTNDELKTLKAACLKAKLRGFQIANAAHLVKELSKEAGVNPPWNTSPRDILNLIAMVELRRTKPDATIVALFEHEPLSTQDAGEILVHTLKDPPETQEAKPAAKRGRPRKNPA